MRLPASVAKPRMRVQSSCATTDGVSSSAMSTHGVSRSCSRSRGAALLVAQVHAQPAGDVVQVALALAQVRIVDVVEDRGHLVERALHRPLGVDALLADDRSRRGRRASGRRASAAARRRSPRGRRPCSSAMRRRICSSCSCERTRARSSADSSRATRSGAIGNRMTCVRWIATSAGPDGDARRDADALQAFHDSSPKPDSTSCASASTAACFVGAVGA